MRVKLFGVRFIFEVKRWFPLSVIYGYVNSLFGNALKLLAKIGTPQLLQYTNILKWSNFEMNANELANAMETRASIRRKATSRKSVQEGANDRLADQLDQAATMLRQQQAEIEELEKENTDLRYLIATKLEQQDGISLNSMAHPITNTPEPSYEINPDKLETIEIDLPSPEPVAWMIQYKDRHKFVFEKPTYSEHVLACEPLYTHPVKELSRMDVYELAIESGFMLSTQYGEAEHKLMPVSDGETLVKLVRAILRKAQEK